MMADNAIKALEFIAQGLPYSLYSGCDTLGYYMEVQVENPFFDMEKDTVPFFSFDIRL